MAKQGYNARLDESLGMRRGPEKGMKQSYKARRDESRGMRDKSGVMGHEKAPMSCDAFAAQRADLGRIQPDYQGNRGYPRQAWEYKY